MFKDWRGDNRSIFVLTMVNVSLLKIITAGGLCLQSFRFRGATVCAKFTTKRLNAFSCDLREHTERKIGSAAMELSISKPRRSHLKRLLRLSKKVFYMHSRAYSFTVESMRTI